MSTTKLDSPKVPATRAPNPRSAVATALLLVAHGVHGGPGIAIEHAAALRRSGLFDEVATACLKGEPSVAAALQSLNAGRIVVLPLLMAEGYSYGRLLSEQLLRASTAREIRLCRALGSLPGMADIAADLALGHCAVRGWSAGNTAIVIAAHGTPRSASSRDLALDLAARLRDRDLFRGVDTAFLGDEPPLTGILRRLGRRQALVLGFFADSGVHGETDVMRLIEDSGNSSIGYAGPIGRTDGVCDLIVATARAAMTECPRKRTSVSSSPNFLYHREWPRDSTSARDSAVRPK